MARRASEFSTAPAMVDSNRPQLRTPDLSRSYQWPFHLRVHPDRWEYVGGRWRLEIERTHLRPGVGGVGGRDVKSINDSKLMEKWAGHGDRKWVILTNGDKRIDPNGFAFLDIVDVCVVDHKGLQEGSVTMASWEVIDSTGNIVNDDAKLNEVADLIAQKLWGMQGPTQRAMDIVARGLKSTIDQLSETASRKASVSPSLAKRLNKLKAKYASVTGVPYDDGVPAVVAIAPALDPQTDLLKRLLDMPAEDRNRLLSALAPTPALAAPPQPEPATTPTASQEAPNVR